MSARFKKYLEAAGAGIALLGGLAMAIIWPYMTFATKESMAAIVERQNRQGDFMGNLSKDTIHDLGEIKVKAAEMNGKLDLLLERTGKEK